ncbi:MAG: hypothetical protein ACQESA_00980 [Patescibacteria group bacterium]
MSKKKEAEERKEKKDQSDRKMFAVLAYLSILVLVPFLVSKEDPFVKFHIKQGFTLLVLWMLYFFLLTALPFFFWSPYSYLLNLFSLFIMILAGIGIFNVLNDREKELPLIGQYSEKFDI